MKTKLFVAMAMAIVMVAGTAQGALVEYRFEFTAADLFNNVFVDGGDGSTPVQNGLFDGARLIEGDATYHRTYVASQHSSFINNWNTHAQAGAVFYDFNLWGLDGRGAGWGEDYKPHHWVSHEGPEEWILSLPAYSNWWSSPPEGYITDSFPRWAAGQDGIQLAKIDANGSEWDVSGLDDFADAAAYQTYLEDHQFAFNVVFNTENMWWGQPGAEDAPNKLPELTLWFGGWMASFDDGVRDDRFAYQGNLVSTGQIIPEPATMTLLGLGLAGFAVKRYRRKRS